MVQDINDRPTCTSFWYVQTAIRSSRNRRAFRDYRSSETTSLRQSQFRSQSRELPHSSRPTAAIMASSVSGVPALCGLPAFRTQCLMETLLQSTRRTGVWMTSANCRAAAPAALLHASIKSMSQYSTCAYSIIIRLKLTVAAHRVLKTTNNDLTRRAK